MKHVAIAFVAVSELGAEQDTARQVELAEVFVNLSQIVVGQLLGEHRK